MIVEPPESFEEVVETGALPARRLRYAADTPRRTLRGTLGWIVGAALLCAVLVGATVALIDRPFASWAHERLAGQRFGWFSVSYAGHSLRFGPFGLMAIPAEVLGRLAALAFVVLAISASAGWRAGIRGRIVLALCLSVFASMEITGLLKEAFGRTWPESWLGDNPSWIRDGVFGFFPIHGGPGWASFPSGHTAMITAPAAILWQVCPGLRMLWGVLVAIVVAGLILGNYHFVSDTIAGLFVGAGIGLGITKLTLTA
jgi:membrane-associated phospholipid phosphatase